MSKNESNKEARERKILFEALKLARSHGSESRRIIDRICLNNNEIVKPKSRPDFCVIGYKDSGEVIESLCAIEHFCIDLNTEKVQKPNKKTNKTVNSAGRGFGEALEKGRLKLMPEVNEHGITENPVKYCAEQSAKAVDIKMRSRYFDYLTELKESLEGHLNKVNEYRENIEGEFGGAKQKICFLIETRGTFPSLVMFNGNTYTTWIKPVLVFTEEIVLVLKKASKYIDYFIITAGSDFSNDVVDAIALDAKNLNRSLKRNKQVIYKYCSNKVLDDLISTSTEGSYGDINHDSDSCSINLDVNTKFKTKPRAYLCSNITFQSEIKKCISSKIPFIALDRLVTAVGDPLWLSFKDSIRVNKK